MQETLQQRETAMRAVLHKIQNKIDFGAFTLEEQRIAKECYDAGFFEGIVIQEMISGRIVAEYRHEPRLTYKGIQFISSEPKTETGSTQNHNQNDELSCHIFKTVKFGWNILWWILGTIATILTIIGGWSHIKTAVSLVISLLSS